MSAENLGARLLSEVQEETLDELLSDIRQSVLPKFASILGFEPLDQLLETFRFPPSDAPQRLDWNSPASHDDSNDGHHNETTPARGSTTAHRDMSKPAVIELTGFKSGRGKTNLLYHLNAVSVLPRSYNGKESVVVWLDSDGRFSALRLYQVIQHVLFKSHPALSSLDREAIARSSLQHVHVFRPQSSKQILSTLHNLSSYLLKPYDHISSTRNLGLLTLDAATAFSSQDRFEAEIARLETTPDTADSHPPFSAPAELIKAFRLLQNQFDCAVLFSNVPTFPSRSITERGPDAGVSPWTAFATLTVTLSRGFVPQFAPHMSTEECRRDQANRFEAVSKGRFMALVDWSGGESWSAGVRDAVERLDGRGAFGFRVVSEGVEVD